MNNIKIPIYLKPIINRIDDFNENLPKENKGIYTTEIIVKQLDSNAEITKGYLGKFDSLQKAYLYARVRLFLNKIIDNRDLDYKIIEL